MNCPLQSFPSPFLLFIICFIIIHNTPTSLSQDDRYSNCTTKFDCGDIKDIQYPFWGGSQAYYCGRPGFCLHCQEDGTLEITISSESINTPKTYRVLAIDEDDQKLTIARKDIWDGNCSTKYENTSFNFTPFQYLPTQTINITLFQDCPPGIPSLFTCRANGTTRGYQFAFTSPTSFMNSNTEMYETCNNSVVISVLEDSVIREGIHEVESWKMPAIERVLRDGFHVEYEGNVEFCGVCVKSGARCGYNWTSLEPACFCPRGGTQCLLKKDKKPRKIIIGISTGIGGILLASAFFLFLFIHLRRKKLLSKSSALISRSNSPDSSKTDLEDGSTYFPTPIFSYEELEEATHNFDSSKELGDGGFGTVYYGKLKDGRVVAVKRLYENNGKRVEQFVNEIKILSRLRHQNLVSLYGGTSRHSRELLLVYEYIPNGTVADHLHGERANAGLLTWPVRMTIAKESADALAYLHASEIIHRDVKTNNILLDNSFHVKVADFGLSRLFPTDATHVSTAPQGTPGYVDPEYYQCYQLNAKSDVYSFGVVLIELISAKPAVDIGRHRHEINLSNMAINKIHNHALHELVDPSLGFESDYNVRRMVTMVAELAFRCLQQDRDMRPTMVEVLEVLKDIENEDSKMEKTQDVDIPHDDASLLKNVQPFSPNSVTDKWVSSTSTTPNTSG